GRICPGGSRWRAEPRRRESTGRSGIRGRRAEGMRRRTATLPQTGRTTADVVRICAWRRRSSGDRGSPRPPSQGGGQLALLANLVREPSRSTHHESTPPGRPVKDKGQGPKQTTLLHPNQDRRQREMRSTGKQPSITNRVPRGQLARSRPSASVVPSPHPLLPYRATFRHRNLAHALVAHIRDPAQFPTS